MDRPRAAIAALAALLLAALLGPALPRLRGSLLGEEYVDHYGTQWFYWFAERQIRAGEGLARTDLFFFPWGKDIFRHTGANVLDAILAVPFRALLGPTLGYNAFLIAMLAASGLAFHRLARDLTGDRLAAGVAALLFACSPYVLFEAAEGRPTQAILLFPVLFLRYLLRIARRPGWRNAVAAGAFLALSGYQYWYYAFFGGVVALAHGLWHAARPLAGSGGGKLTFARHALVAAVALALTVPAALPLLRAADVPGLLDTARWSLRASPPVTVEGLTIGLQLWQPLRGYAGFYVMDRDGTERFLESAVLMPWLFLPLVALACWRPGILARGSFLAMVAAVILLAMGPLVLVGDGALPNPLWIGLAKIAGFVRRLWWPARAMAYGTILLGMAAAACLAALGGRPRLQLAAAGLLTALWGAELYRGKVLPFPAWDAGVPAGYRCLASGPPGALIELPYAWTQAHLYYQTVHGRPIFGGMLEDNAAFTPPELLALKEGNAFLSSLLDLARSGQGEIAGTAAEKQALRDLGYRYVVLQRDAFAPRMEEPGLLGNALRTRHRRMREQLRAALGEPVYADARVLVYAPWGDPSPCAPGSVQPDLTSPGRTEVTVDARLVRGPDEQVIWRVLR